MDEAVSKELRARQPRGRPAPEAFLPALGGHAAGLGCALASQRHTLKLIPDGVADISPSLPPPSRTPTSFFPRG